MVSDINENGKKSERINCINNFKSANSKILIPMEGLILLDTVTMSW